MRIGQYSRQGAGRLLSAGATLQKRADKHQQSQNGEQLPPELHSHAGQLAVESELSQTASTLPNMEF